MDTTIINNGNTFQVFNIYRKLDITKAQIKSNSNMALNISVAAFLSKAYDFCSKPILKSEEIRFLIIIFTKNDYERSKLQNSPLLIRTIVKNTIQFILVKPKKRY